MLYLKKQIIFFMALTIFFIGQAWANPDQIDLKLTTNMSSFKQGADSLTAKVAVNNSGAARSVDVHFAIISPDGTIYEWPDWNTNLKPVLSNWTLPAGMNLPETELFTLSINDQKPFKHTGSYQMVFVMMEPGTYNPVSNMAYKDFKLTSNSSQKDKVGSVHFEVNTNYSNEGNTDITASGSFLANLNQTPSNRYFIGTELETLAKDTCQVSSYTIDLNDMSEYQPKFLDAGPNINLTSPTNSYSIPRQKESIPDLGMEMIFYLNESMTQADYQAGAQYTFSGEGGPDVGSFSTTITAPEKFQLLTPDLSTKPNIARDQDLNIEWSSPTNQNDVWISIRAGEMNMQEASSTIYTCQCRFSDDGQGTIPKDKLEKLPVSNFETRSEIPTSISAATMDAFRVNWKSFDVEGLDQGFGMITSGESGTINLQ